MTAKDVFELLKQGRIEEAYNAIRPLYATDKGPYTSLAMFWTATDILKKRLSENRIDEAKKIFAALERMLPNVPDKESRISKAFKRCQELLERSETRNYQREEGAEHLRTGIMGEEIASAYLREKGYIILERDWHSGHRDIDIIALHEDTIVFVEVKTRRSHDYAAPVTAVDRQKQRNLLAAINHYLQYKQITSAHRFDVITIICTSDNSIPEIEHIENFQLSRPLYSGGHRWR